MSLYPLLVPDMLPEVGNKITITKASFIYPCCAKKPKGMCYAVWTQDWTDDHFSAISAELPD